MKNKGKIFSYAITIFVLALFVYYFVNNTEAFKELLDIPVWLLVLLIVMKYIRIFNSGQFTTATLLKFDKRIPAREGFYIALLSSIGNFFGPFLGGAGIRAVYLKQKYKFTFTNFASTLSGLYVIQFTIFSLAGLISLVGIHIAYGRYSIILYLAFIALLIACQVTMYVRSITGIVSKLHSRFKIANHFLNKVNDVVKGWQIIRRDGELFKRLLILTIIGLVISFIIQYIQFVAIDADVSFLSIVLYISLSALTLLISITPSSIGVREAIFLFSSSLLALDTRQILQLALIDRGATLFVMASGYVFVKIYNKFKPAQIEAND